MAIYHNIWKKHFGEIPKDESGRSFEIHHINGNHSDNSIENLKLITIEEHYQVHLEQEDWAACALISKRMGLPPSHCSDIQRGKKRPGIGGAPKGRIPWNKGKGGYKLNVDRKGKRHSSKLSLEKVTMIRTIHENKEHVKEYFKELERRRYEGIYGKELSYEWFLSKWIQQNILSSFSALGIYKVIMKKTWTNV